MTRDEMTLLADLRRLCAEAPAFALAFPDNGLPVADELEYGCRLLEVAHRILSHTRRRGENGAGNRSGVRGMPPAGMDVQRYDVVQRMREP